MSDWNTYTLSQVGSIVTGNTPSTKNNAFWIGEIPFYSPADFNGSVYCENTERTVSEEALIYGRLIPKNSIMVTCIGSIGKMSISRKSGLTNQQINSLVPFENFEFKYIYYLILNNIEKFKNLAPQTTIPILNKSEFGKFSFRFHKLPEQKKIATILQSIDKTIEKTEALIAKYQLIKAGLMQDLFTRGIGADGKLRPTREQAPELYQETQIGWIPRDWVCDEIKNFVTSAQYGVSISLSDEENGIPVLRMNNIKNNKFDVSDLKYSDSVEAVMIKMSEGDVLYNRTNSMEHVGKTAIWKNELPECSFASYLVRMNLKVDTLLPEFFSHWMSQDSSQIALRRYATPAVQQVNINPTNVQKVLIACPQEIAEQQIIFEKIDAIDSKIFGEEKILFKLEQQKQGLMHDLLTGKKRVTVNEYEAEADHV